jgi:iron uptake system EfeUOB component EfeO/EfeM
MPSNRLKLLLAGAIGVLALVVVGLGVIYVTLRRPAAAPNAVTIEVSDTACTPDSLSVAAGTPSFSIRNTSNRTIEWEILNGVMVVAERENIAPGFTVELTPRLAPGTYEMTCGLLSNPRGALIVTAADGSLDAAPKPPTQVDLVAPTAEYRVYAISTVNTLARATVALRDAVKGGSFEEARKQAAVATDALYGLAPVLHLFPQDTGPLTSGPAALPALGRSLAQTPPDPAVAGLADVAAKSASALGGSVVGTTASPHEIVAGAGSIVAALAKDFDPTVASAQLAGVRKVVELFRPLTLRADKSLAAKIDGDLAALESKLGQSAAPTAQAIEPQLTDLSADMTDLLSALGLNVT